MESRNDASVRGTVADPAREELMLKIQASILERYLRKEVQEKQTVEQRCQLLRQKITSMEDELSKAGKSAAARRCLEDSSRSEFDAVDHGEFLRWLALDPGSASCTPRQEHALLSTPSKKRTDENVPALVGHGKDGFHVFSVELLDQSPSHTHRTKRARYTSKDTPPCLRCRILKKKCDELEACSHCPTQGFDNENDFWKVLGCFRGHLRDMVDIFCPSFSRATSRTLNDSISGIKFINFVLTKSRVSDSKRGRIMHLIHHVDDFKSLAAFAWENIHTREQICRSAMSLEQYQDLILDDVVLQDYESAWAVLQLVSMDRIYLTNTAYNLFTLMRLGSCYANTNRTRWNIFSQAKKILRQSVELYLLERLCDQIASGTMNGPIPFDTTKSTPNTLVLVDLKEDVESFLHAFERLCAGRAKLTGSSQMAAFFALLVFSIVKSILTDAYVFRDEYEDKSPWSIDHALKITSAYKGLVSVFCWASKSDVMLQPSEEEPAPIFVNQIQEMVNLPSWNSLGFKSTKDFLLSLGICILPDGSFNGFLPQKFGIDAISKISGQHASRVVSEPPVGYSRADSDAHVGSSPSAITNASRPLVNYPSITFVTPDNGENQTSSRGYGGRKGALDLETLERVREVRKVGACWNCWVMKAPCSEGVQCERCQRTKGSLGESTYRVCNRGSFNNIFTSVLFPDFLFDQFRIENVQAFIYDWIYDWTEFDTTAQVTWGSEIEMNILLREFVPQAAQDLFHSQNGQILEAQPLPFAISPEKLEEVTYTYSGKLKSLIHGPNFPSYNNIYQYSELVRMVLEIVQRYSEQNPENQLIRSCLALYLALYFGVQPTVFPASSTQSKSILELMAVPSQVYTSRLLNHQTKSIFYRLATTYVGELLNQIEKLMRTRDKATWPACFAAMLMLCVCVERLQMVSVAQTQFAKSVDQDTTSDSEPQKSCQAMEDIVFGQLTHVFHTLFRTHKADQGGLNPFLSGDDEVSGSAFDDASMIMIREIKEKIFYSPSFLLVQDPSLPKSSALGEFSRANSGRLVSIFLLSFNPTGNIARPDVYETVTTLL